MDEDDIATYTIKTLDDPRTLNKTLYLRPPDNILSQRQLVEMWEKLSGNKLERSSISVDDFLGPMKGNSFQNINGKVIFSMKYKLDCLSILSSHVYICIYIYNVRQIWTMQAKLELGISITYFMKVASQTLKSGNGEKKLRSYIQKFSTRA